RRYRSLPSCRQLMSYCSPLFFLDARATPLGYTLSLHDALPISPAGVVGERDGPRRDDQGLRPPGHLPAHRSAAEDVREAEVLDRSEEHTSELQSLRHLVCRLLLEKKKEQPHRTSTLTIPPHIAT